MPDPRLQVLSVDDTDTGAMSKPDAMAILRAAGEVVVLKIGRVQKSRRASFKRVRQLRHCFGLFCAHFQATLYLTCAVYLLSAVLMLIGWVLIGACYPMFMPD